MNQIITISRQFGSGGRTIGKMVADRLGIPCYNKELIEKVAAESGYAKAYVEEEGEYAPRKSFFSYSFIGRGQDGLSNEDHLWFAQRKVIKELAEKESCVIVGRCADYALSEEPNCVNAFIYADKTYRIKRVAHELGISESKAKDMVNRTDKERASYYNFYTNKKWGDSRSYDLALNSEKLGIDGCVDMLIRFADINQQ